MTVTSSKFFAFFAWALTAISLAGCNLGFVSFDTREPGRLQGGMPIPVAKNISLLGPNRAELGVCTKLTVRAETTEGAPQAVTTDTLVDLSLSTGSRVKLYAARSECESDEGTSTSGSLDAVTLRKGETSVDLWARAVDGVPFTVIVLSDKLGFHSKPLNVIRTARRIRFVEAPDTVDGGRCNDANRFVVEIQDGMGQPFSGTGLAVGLTDGGNGQFLSSCGGTPLSSITVNQASRVFYYRNSRIETDLTVKGAVSGKKEISVATKQVSVRRVVDNLRVGRPNNDAILLNECTPVVVEIRDSENQIFASHGGRTVRLSRNQGNAVFFSTASNCQNEIGGSNNFSFQVPNGAGSLTLYFRPKTYQGNLQMVANDQGDAEVDAGSLTVNNIRRDPRRLVFTMSPNPATTGLCSGPFRVQVQDAVGDGFVNSGVTFNLSGGGAGTFYTNSNCTSAVSGPVGFAPNSSTVDLYYRNNTVEPSVTVTARAAGNPNPTISDAQVSFEVRASVTDLAIIGGPAGNLILGECAAFQVETLDAVGNRVSTEPRNIRLEMAAGSGRYFASATDCDNDTGTGNRTQSLSNVAGVATFYFRPTSTGTVTLRAEVIGEEAVDGQLTKNVDRVATEIAISGPSTATVGPCSPAFTLTLRDGLGVAFTSHAGVQTSLTNLGELGYFNDERCENEATNGFVMIGAGSATRQFYVRPRSAGSVSFRAMTTATMGVPALTSAFHNLTLNSDSLGLHTDFSSNGREEYHINPGAGSSDSAAAVIQLSDGRMLAVGTSRTSADWVGLVKFNAFGDLDAGFDGAPGAIDGENGRLFVLNGGKGAAAVADNGAFWVAGSLDGQFFVARFLNNGVLDTGFGTNGVAKTSFPAAAEGRALVRLSSGNLAVAGRVGTGNAARFGLAVFTSAGAVQTQTDYDFGDAEEAFALAVDTLFGEEYLVLAGQSRHSSGRLRMAALRVDEAGNEDTAFGTGGRVVLDPPSSQETVATGVAVSGGNVFLAGTYRSGLTQDMVLAKIAPNGSLVTAFDGDGYRFLAPGGQDTAHALTVDLAGNLLIAGQSGTGSSARVYLARVSAANGTTLRERSYTLGSGNAAPHAVTVRQDGEIFLAGTTAASGGRVLVSRHLP